MAEGGAIRITVQNRLHELRQPKVGLLDRSGDVVVGHGAGELLVGGIQIGAAALETLFAGISRHQRSSGKLLEEGRDAAPRRNYVSKTNFIPANSDAGNLL
jgi:hypothetical protein